MATDRKKKGEIKVTTGVDNIKIETAVEDHLVAPGAAAFFFIFQTLSREP